MSIYLVCEGPHDGLDVRVLDLSQAFSIPMILRNLQTG